MSTEQRITELEAEVALLRAELANARAVVVPFLEQIESNDPEANRQDADKLANGALAYFRTATPNPNCGCHACNPDAWWMVVCETCGNKRCPHATDHRHACTNSNEPGQPGSIFGTMEQIPSE